MITIKEIAMELGVSATTVSNVVNGHTQKMSRETKDRVEEALARYQYEINVKKNNGTSENRMIAVIYHMSHEKNVLLDPFCAELLGAIEEEAKSLHRYVMYYVTDTSSEDMLKRVLAPWNVDGAVLLGYEPTMCSAVQCSGRCQNHWSLSIPVLRRRNRSMIISAFRILKGPMR